MVKTSSYGFAETVERLTAAMHAGGQTVFATIDQAAAATTVGLKLRPTTLIVFGNPKGGTPFMDAAPLLALDLPLKMLVWEENGAVSVAYVPMSEIVARYGVTAHDAQVAVMDRALDTLSGSVATPS